MAAVEHHLPVYHGAPGVLQVGPARPQGLYLCPLQLDAGLEALFHEVIVEGFFVLGNGFCVGLACTVTPPLRNFLQTDASFGTLIIPHLPVEVQGIFPRGQFFFRREGGLRKKEKYLPILSMEKKNGTGTQGKGRKAGIAGFFPSRFLQGGDFCRKQRGERGNFLLFSRSAKALIKD